MSGLGGWEAYVRERLRLPELPAVRQLEVAAELAQQLEQAEQEAAARGLSPAAARAAAEAQISDWTNLALSIARAEAPVEARLPRRVLAWSDAARDLRHTLRGWRRAPGLAVIAILTLALGIGATTAIFSWVNSELLRALPFPQAGRLVVLKSTAHGRNVSVSYPDYLDWKAEAGRPGSPIAAMSWDQTLGFNLSGAGQPEVVNAADVSANFFSTLGVTPLLGRQFSPGSDTASAKREAILSDRLARRHFGEAARALGQTINLDAGAYTVVGVLSPGFRDPDQTDVYIPSGVQLKNNAERGDRGDTSVIARLAPGASLTAARDRIAAVAERLARTYPESNADVGAAAMPLRAAFVGDDAAMLWLLFAAVGLVLLIACANVANLMLTRTAARQQEWTIKQALGAGRGRLLRQVLLESLLLGLAGAMGGLAAAAAAMRGLAALLPQATHVDMSWPVLGFAALAGLLAAVIFGLGPALMAGRESLHASRRGAAAQRGRKGLVVAEVGLALMLAAGAGLTIKSFTRLMAVNPGFQPQHVLTWSTRLAGPQYSQKATQYQFDHQVLQRLAALPGVEAAALGTNLPLTGDHSRADVTIVGRPLPAPGHFPHPDLHRISPGYLAALGLPLLYGRNFSEQDGAANAPPVALVSASFAASFWPKGQAVGKQFRGGHGTPDEPLYTVIGVVGDTQQYGLNAPARLEVYLPYQQSAPATPTFLVRTSLPPLSLRSAVTGVMHAVDPAAPVENVQTMDQVLAASVANPHATLWLLGLFGAVALLLAAIGIYGVVSFAAQQRTAEIGIRMAMGASRGAVAQLIAGDSLRLLGLGVALGLAGVLAVGRWLASSLYQVSATDPAILIGVAVLLFLVGCLASLLPVRRAMQVDPLNALRHE
jgi:putative ABC transport system permease protein